MFQYRDKMGRLVGIESGVSASENRSYARLQRLGHLSRYAVFTWPVTFLGLGDPVGLKHGRIELEDGLH